MTVGFQVGDMGCSATMAGFVPILSLANEFRTIFPGITVHYRGIPDGVCTDCGWITARAESA